MNWEGLRRRGEGEADVVMGRAPSYQRLTLLPQKKRKKKTKNMKIIFLSATALLPNVEKVVGYQKSVN